MQSTNRVLSAFAIFALALMALVLPNTSVESQETIPLQYGTAAIGTVAEGTQVAYGFAGNIGDLVTIRATGITPGMDPSLTLVGPAQEILAGNDNPFINPANTSAEIVYRLLADGSYTILVGGTAGDFLLTVTVRPAVTVTMLELDTPYQLALPTDGVQVLAFNTDPFGSTSLLIDADPIDLNAIIEVRDATGAQVATLQNNLDNACLSLGPGDELAEVTVVGQPDAAGSITVTLGRGPCQLGPAPEAPVQPVLQFQPVAIEGVCAASTVYNLNVRSGPGLNYPVLFVNPARLPLQVTGVSADGQWYAIQTSGGLQGWVAVPIVVIVGPCEPLNVVEAQEPPAASPTPGLPEATLTVEMTATVDPTATPEAGEPTETLEPQPPTATLPPADEPTATPEEPVEEPTPAPEETEAAS